MGSRAAPPDCIINAKTDIVVRTTDGLPGGAAACLTFLLSFAH
jgi:hypothetical protein